MVREYRVYRRYSCSSVNRPINKIYCLDRATYVSFKIIIEDILSGITPKFYFVTSFTHEKEEATNTMMRRALCWYINKQSTINANEAFELIKLWNKDEQQDIAV